MPLFQSTQSLSGKWHCFVRVHSRFGYEGRQAMLCSEVRPYITRIRTWGNVGKHRLKVPHYLEHSSVYWGCVSPAMHSTVVALFSKEFRFTLSICLLEDRLRRDQDLTAEKFLTAIDSCGNLWDQVSILDSMSLGKSAPKDYLRMHSLFPAVAYHVPAGWVLYFGVF